MPLPSIRTSRLLLRPWNRDDIDALYAFFTAAEVRRYLWDDIVIAREVVEKLVDAHLETAEKHGIGYWVLLLPDATPQTPVAGFCGFRFIDDGPEIELMYGLRVEHWGQGLATEASLAALEYLWRATSFPRVYARTDPPNQKSVGVMLRLGMAHESTTPTMIAYVREAGRSATARPTPTFQTSRSAKSDDPPGGPAS